MSSRKNELRFGLDLVLTHIVVFAENAIDVMLTPTLKHYVWITSSLSQFHTPAMRSIHRT